MNKEVIGKAKLLLALLEPGAVIDKDVSKAAEKTLEELILIASREMERKYQTGMVALTEHR